MTSYYSVTVTMNISSIVFKISRALITSMKLLIFLYPTCI